MLIEIDGLVAPAIDRDRRPHELDALGCSTTYSSPALMNATSSTPPLSAAITGCEEAPASPGSTRDRRLEAPPASTSERTRAATPLTFLT